MSLRCLCPTGCLVRTSRAQASVSPLVPAAHRALDCRWPHLYCLPFPPPSISRRLHIRGRACPPPHLATVYLVVIALALCPRCPCRPRCAARHGARAFRRRSLRRRALIVPARVVVSSFLGAAFTRPRAPSRRRSLRRRLPVSGPRVPFCALRLRVRVSPAVPEGRLPRSDPFRVRCQCFVLGLDLT